MSLAKNYTPQQIIDNLKKQIDLHKEEVKRHKAIISLIDEKYTDLTVEFNRLKIKSIRASNAREENKKSCDENKEDIKNIYRIIAEMHIKFKAINV